MYIHIFMLIGAFFVVRAGGESYFLPSALCTEAQCDGRFGTWLIDPAPERNNGGGTSIDGWFLLYNVTARLQNKPKILAIQSYKKTYKKFLA
jgi:hypothetical protein